MPGAVNKMIALRRGAVERQRSKAVNVGHHLRRGKDPLTRLPGNFTLAAAQRFAGWRFGGEDIQPAVVDFKTPLAKAKAWRPQLAAYRLAALADGSVRWSGRGDGGRLDAQLRLSRLSFSNAAGTQAGEKIGASVTLDAEQAGRRWHWRASLDWESGEAYVQPFYFARAGARTEAQGVLDGRTLSIAKGRADMADIGGAVFAAGSIYCGTIARLPSGRLEKSP